MDIERARTIGIPGATILFLMICLFRVWIMTYRLSMSRLTLGEGVLEVVGLTSWGLRTRSIPLSDLQSISLGLPSDLPKILDQRAVSGLAPGQWAKTMRESRLVVRTVEDEIINFNFVAQTFETKPLRRILQALSDQGIRAGTGSS